MSSFKNIMTASIKRTFSSSKESAVTASSLQVITPSASRKFLSLSMFGVLSRPPVDEDDEDDLGCCDAKEHARDHLAATAGADAVLRWASYPAPQESKRERTSTSSSSGSSSTITPSSYQFSSSASSSSRNPTCSPSSTPSTSPSLPAHSPTLSPKTFSGFFTLSRFSRSPKLVNDEDDEADFGCCEAKEHERRFLVERDGSDAALRWSTSTS